MIRAKSFITSLGLILKEQLAKNKYWLLGIGAILSYWYYIPMIAANESTSLQMKGTITLNLLIVYYFAGVFADRLGRGKSKMVGWIIFFVIIGVLSMILRIANEQVGI